MSANDERLLQAVRAGGIGIFDHDHATDIIYWSAELRQFYGFTPHEVVTMGTIVAQCFPEDLPRVGAAAMRAHSPEGDGSFDIEHRIITRGGELRWMLTRSTTLFGGEGPERHP